MPVPEAPAIEGRGGMPQTLGPRLRCLAPYHPPCFSLSAHDAMLLSHFHEVLQLSTQAGWNHKS